VDIGRWKEAAPPTQHSPYKALTTKDRQPGRVNCPRSARSLGPGHVRKTFYVNDLARRDECPQRPAIRGHSPWTPSGLDLQLFIHEHFTLGRQLCALVLVSTSIYFSLGIFMALLGLGPSVLRGSFSPESAATERPVFRRRRWLRVKRIIHVGWVKVAQVYGGSSQTDQPLRSVLSRSRRLISDRRPTRTTVCSTPPYSL
jgi:hypothetical protein